MLSTHTVTCYLRKKDPDKLFTSDFILGCPLLLKLQQEGVCGGGGKQGVVGLLHGGFRMQNGGPGQGSSASSQGSGVGQQDEELRVVGHGQGGGGMQLDELGR